MYEQTTSSYKMELQNELSQIKLRQGTRNLGNEPSEQNGSSNSDFIPGGRQRFNAIQRINDMSNESRSQH